MTHGLNVLKLILEMLTSREESLYRIVLHVFRLQYVLARLVDAGILKECEQVCTLVFYTFQFIYTYIP